MTLKAGKIVLLVAAAFCLLLGSAGPVFATGETMYDYTKIPPFIEIGLDPNLLMLIDNSASMYDQAYAPVDQDYCYAGDVVNADGTTTSYAAYDQSKSYTGYALDDSWYFYWGAPYQSYTNATYFNNWNYNVAYPQKCTNLSGYGTLYKTDGLCLWVDNSGATPVVTLVAASGNFLNWLASSKFDVEKKILTGGKYDASTGQLIMESRGCEGKDFIKKVAVTDPSDTTYYATFGIHQTSATDYTTKIDIFAPTTEGFDFGACKDAIDYWTNPSANLGTLFQKTSYCMEAAGTTLSASNTAFNHILQECWYYKAHGDWQDGVGTVNSLKNDCENVYNATPGGAPGADYQAPQGLKSTDVCFGQYDYTHPAGGPWGYGYVGQCWKPYSSGGFTYEDRACDPSVDPTTKASNPYCDSTTSKWKICNGNYVSSGSKCVGTPGTWIVLQDAVPNVGDITSVDWTDDADANITLSGSNPAYDCVDRALKKYCVDTDEQTVVDSTEVNDPEGTAWGIPAVLVSTAAESQLGPPLFSMNGKVYNTIVGNTFVPRGLIQQFKFNLRMGAMQFNPGAGNNGECHPVMRPDGTYKASLYDCLTDKGAAITASSVRDPGQLDGGRIISYIDDGDVHTAALVHAINNIVADSWTPISEAYSEALGYFTQKTARRLNSGDYTCDQDYSSNPSAYPAWTAGHYYAPGSKVHFDWDYDDNGIVDETKIYFTILGGTSTAGVATIKDDKGVKWTPYDPVEAGCQHNNILIITDGGSTADLNSTMTNFVTSGNNDGDSAVTYAPLHTEAATGGEFTCKASDGSDNLFGSSLLDDLSYYAYSDTFPDIYSYPTVNNIDKQKITTWVVSAGNLHDDGTGYDCNPMTLLQETTANSDTTLLESSDPSELETNLRNVFVAIGGEPQSGSAASVISNSRSGDGSVFQAVFYPSQEDENGKKIVWAGDVHALWLDEKGNIREDCNSAGGCAAGDEDQHLDKTEDNILQFYTDPVSGSARARSFSDTDGDGKPDAMVSDNLSLRDIPFIWSGGEWLAGVTQSDTTIQRAYNSTDQKRYIVTSLDGTHMVPFTASATSGVGLRTGILSSDSAYEGYFHAASVDEANDIVNYIRGQDNQVLPDGVTSRNYRSRLINWDGSGNVYWKLGDIVDSTPTVVSTPAEDYDLIYGDKSYLAFRQRYRNRRTVIYAGGNDGGLHAFNAGYFNRATGNMDNAPPADATYDPSPTDFALGAEMWMFVPKNLFPHLKWLTDPNYTHVDYVDMQPYVFDAKIFHPDTDHPDGWGTVLVGGLGFGGGDIGVDIDGDGVDDLTLRSEYFVLDITNPEVAPKILGEFTDPNLGFSTGAPTAFPLLLCNLNQDCPDNMPMDWYLAIPSGPHAPDATSTPNAMNGRSDQWARLFTMPLGGTNYTGHLNYVNTFKVGSTHRTYNEQDTDTNFPYSFFSDVIAVDYDIDFKTDALYFGTVANANTDETDQNTGALNRLVINGDSNAADWTMNTFFRTPGNRPVTGAPGVASDGQRIWVYFGTGRYISAHLDKQDQALQSFYGIKENYDVNGNLVNSSLSGSNLVDVSKVWVEDGGNLHLTSGSFPLQAINYSSATTTTTSLPVDVDTFDELNAEMSAKDGSGLDKYNGWKLDFLDHAGERNMTQPAVLGNIVTFTSYVPSQDPCEPEGEGYLWAVFYRTGTAYKKSVMGTQNHNGLTEVSRYSPPIHGDPSPPNLHRGGEQGSTAYVQTSTGAIISIQQDNPGIIKSGAMSWRECNQ